MKFKSAKIIIYDKNNNILLLTRSDTHPKYPLHLDLPGGIVEENENNEIAIIRECIEETGLVLDINNIKLVKNVEFSYFSRNLFETKLDKIEPEIKLSWEHSEYKWFSEEEIRKMNSSKKYDPYYNMLVEYLKNKDDK